MIKTRVSLIIGIAVLAATIASFFIIQPMMIAATIVGFVFVLYSEIVFFTGIILAERFAKNSSGITIRSGVGMSVLIYSAIVFISSIYFMIYHSFFIRWFLVGQIILAVIVFAVVAVLVSLARTFEDNDRKILQSNAMIDDFKNRLLIIQQEMEKKELLEPIIEGLRYTDVSVTVEADVDIDKSIDDLQALTKKEEYSSEEIDSMINNLEFLIKKRNLQTKSAKAGSI